MHRTGVGLLPENTADGAVKVGTAVWVNLASWQEGPGSEKQGELHRKGGRGEEEGGRGVLICCLV